MENEERTDQRNTSDNRTSNEDQDQASRKNDEFKDDDLDDTDPNLHKDKSDPTRRLFY
jgi:hypothetical protein